MELKIPPTRRCVQVDSYNPNVIRGLLGMRFAELPVKPPDDDQVLVKMEAASCNPSDIAFLQGGYNVVKSLPAIPGFEGSGLVIACGRNALHLMGKRVSCFAQEDGDGTWADYFVTKAKNCIEAGNELSAENAATFAINPFTAYGLFKLAQMKKCRAIVINAAGSQVAGMIRALAKRNGMETINLARKEKQVLQLLAEGEKNVLCTANNSFFEKLFELSHLINATIAFDAVGGEQTGLLFSAMPPGSEVVVYGGLSGKPVSGIEILDVIFKEKKLSGFNLNNYLALAGKEELNQLSLNVKELFRTGVFNTRVQGQFKLSDFVKAIRQYLGNMSEGKILLIP